MLLFRLLLCQDRYFVGVNIFDKRIEFHAFLRFCNIVFLKIISIFFLHIIAFIAVKQDIWHFHVFCLALHYF